jgi:hypothetical protein
VKKNRRPTMLNDITNRKRIIKTMAFLAFAAGAVDILFWALYLSGSISFGPADSVAAHFESAFLFADAVLAVILFISGIGLLKRQSYGPICLIIAAGMALYLGILDVTFYLGHGLYLPLNASSLFEIFINAVCLLGGAAGLIIGLLILSISAKGVELC